MSAHVRCQSERLKEEERHSCKQIICAQLWRGVTGPSASLMLQKTIIHSKPERMKELRTEIRLNQGNVEKGMNFREHEHKKNSIHQRKEENRNIGGRDWISVADIPSLRVKGKGDDYESELWFTFCYEQKTTKPNSKKKEKIKEDQVCRESPLIVSLPAKLVQRIKNTAVQMFGEKWVSHHNWVFFPHHTGWLAKSA